MYVKACFDLQDVQIEVKKQEEMGTQDKVFSYASTSPFLQRGAAVAKLRKAETAEEQAKQAYYKAVGGGPDAKTQVGQPVAIEDPKLSDMPART